MTHCVKSDHIRSYSGPYFPAFGLNRDRYEVSFRIQSEYEKIRTRITPNTDTFHEVTFSVAGSTSQKIIIYIIFKCSGLQGKTPAGSLWYCPVSLSVTYKAFSNFVC